jgi:hypothetical protein
MSTVTTLPIATPLQQQQRRDSYNNDVVGYKLAFPLSSLGGCLDDDCHWFFQKRTVPAIVLNLSNMKKVRNNNV